MEYTIDLQGKTFSIFFSKKQLAKGLEIQNGKIGLQEAIPELAIKDLVRGSFLGGGSINNPEKKYHLEIKFSQEESKRKVQALLQSQNFAFKELATSPVLYLKEGEEISRFLAWCGANSGVLRFEEIRVMREVRNNVNRLVNCETANLNKTINSAVKQMEDIKWIKQNHKFGELTKPLQEIAELRMKYPDKTLIELGQMLEEPIGKSGVNHRLKAISKLAEELRNKEKKS